MLKYSEYRKVQELKAAGVSQRQIVKETGHTVYAVRKIWDLTEEEFLAGSKFTHDQMDEYKEDILEILRAYPTIRNMTILDRIREKYPHKEIAHGTFYKYMVKLREVEGFVKNGERVLTKREDLPPGYEAQADMGQAKLRDMYGAEVKVYFFCMVLSYSRMRFAYFSAEPFDTNRFLYAHEKAFKYYGGRPEVIMYDQDRVMVVSENAGNVVYTRAFDEYRQRANFKVFLCRASDPDTKGRVENLVRFVKTSFLDNREYTGIDSLNSACLAWLDRTGNGNICAATRRVPREMFEVERLRLAEHRPQNLSLYKQKIVSASDINTVTYLKNRYDLPAGMHAQGDRLRIEDDGSYISIIEPTKNELVIKHKKASGEGQFVKSQVIPKPPNQEVLKAKALYENNLIICNFIDKICEEKPRYITQQCRMLKKIHKQYGAEKSLTVIDECVRNCKFDATEVLALLVKNHGVEQAKKVLPVRTHKHYIEKAKGLSKYAALAEDS